MRIDCKKFTKQSVIEQIANHVERQGDAVAFTFLSKAGKKSQQLSFAQLDNKAKFMAAHLASRFEAGQRLLLALPAGGDYVCAFVACLYAGIVAVPTYPPRSARKVEGFANILSKSGASGILYSDAVANNLEGVFELVSSGKVEAVDLVNINQDFAGDMPFTPPTIVADDLAFLQFSSGSTGSPKGIMISHGNLSQNICYLGQTVDVRQDDVAVHWLPPFHDMGLICGIIFPLFHGIHSVLIPSMDFVIRPLVWLQAIAKYGGTFSGSPNFGYDHCLNRISADDIASLDLSSWRVAYCAAEMINPRVLERFSDTFAPALFSEQAWRSAYGMAESTVLVCGTSEPPQFNHFIVSGSKVQLVTDKSELESLKSTYLCSLGQAFSGHDLRIVSLDDGSVVDELTIGEVWFKGPSVSKGYYNQSDLTKQSFALDLAADGSSGYMRTGDLGFIYEGQLYITSRLKEVIIVNGINYIPTDLEQVLDSQFDPLIKNATVAFSAMVNGVEQALIATEVNRKFAQENHQQLATDIGAEILATFGLDLNRVLLVQQGGLPRTTSGKLKRAGFEKHWRDGAVKVLFDSSEELADSDATDSKVKDLLKVSEPVDELTAQIAVIWQQVLNVSLDEAHCNILQSGGNSIAILKIQGQIKARLGVEVPFELLLGANSFHDVSAYVAEHGGALNIAGSLPSEEQNEPEKSHQITQFVAGAAQQRLYFIDLLEQDSSHYHLVKTFKVSGALDRAALRIACQHLFVRHQSLHSNFKYEDEVVYCILRPQRQIEINFEQVESGELADIQAQQFLAQWLAEPFDLANDCLMRVNVVALSSQEYYLQLMVHHIVIDGWSAAIVVQELEQLYKAFYSGQYPQLPALEYQYSDYQAQEQLSRDFSTAETYWQQQLANMPQVHQLPTDRPRPAKQSFVGASFEMALSTTDYQQVTKFCAEHQVTEFTVLQTALSIMLHKYSGENDIVVGVPVANRDVTKFERLVGLCTNNVLIRTRFDQQFDKQSGDCTLLQVLQQVKSDVLNGFKHQQYPFDSLVELLGHPRSLSYNPLFQIKLDVHNFELQDLHLAGANAQEQEQMLITTRYDLELFALPCNGGMSLRWIYKTELFDQTTIERFNASLLHILRTMMYMPQMPISKLSVISEQDKTLLLDTWQGAKEDYPQNTTVPALFEQQVIKSPDAIAVNEHGTTISFAKLNEQANQMAHYLHEQGVGPDVCVAICLERSVDMVVAILAILKAGGAYVPIDMRYSAERIAHIVEDADCAMMLSSQELMMEFTDYLECQVFPMDASFRCQVLASFSTDNLAADDIGLEAHHLAYVIYTSGSTGIPKGVMVEHQGLLMYCGFARDHYYQNVDASLLLGSIGFDLTAPTLFLPLLYGGSVVLGEEGNEIEHLSQLLQQATASDNKPRYVLRLTPSHLAALLELMPTQPLGGEHVFVIGGEEFPLSILQRVQSLLPQSRWFNHYGPTEGVIGCTMYALPAAASLTGSVPIGRPHSNHSIYVMNEQQQLVPIGATGELYIASSGLARGYLGLEAMTAERFIADPFVDGGRMYRTGDLVRWQSDGLLVFVGRADNQVKVRGFRIELGDIEAHLTQLEEIKQAVVVTREVSQGDAGEQCDDHQGQGIKQLVAYVQLNELLEYDDEALLLQHKSRLITAFKASLTQSLADHMVPEIYVFVSGFELTINGKVNHKALPEPTESDLFKAHYVAPRNVIESQLCEIWQQLLNLEEVGIEDNFFSLGGDSIISIQVVTRAKKSGLKLTVRDIFDHQTISELSSIVEMVEVTTIDQQSATGQLAALLPAQQRFFALPLTTKHHHNQAVLLGLKVNDVKQSQLKEVLSALYQRHDGLRLRFDSAQAQGNFAYYQDFDPVMVEQSFAYFDLSRLDSDKERSAQVLALGDKLQASFDLEQGVLFKLAYFDFGADGGQLLICAHHLLVDGVSWRIILTDIEQGFVQLTQGESIHLEPKTSSLAHFSEVLVEQAQLLKDKDNAERYFWLEQLSQTVPVIPSANSAQQETVSAHFSLDKTQVGQLLGECHLPYRTQVNDLLLAALYLGYCQFAKVDTMRVEMEGHGRQLDSEVDGLDITETVGWFTAVYPVIISAKGKALSELIMDIKECNRVMPNGGSGYGLMKYFNQDAQLLLQENAHSEAAIYFNYLGQLDNVTDNSALFTLLDENAGQSIAKDDKQLKPISIEGRVKNFCLTFDIDSFVLSQSQLDDFASCFEQALMQVIEHCIEAKAHFTHSDLPLAELTDSELKQVSQLAQVKDVYLTTPMQQGLIFQSLYNQERSPYISQFGFEINGKMDVECFKQAWQVVVNRHDIYRSSFFNGEHAIHQILHDKVTLPVIELDWSAEDKNTHSQLLAEYLVEDKQKGVDFAIAPLMRITLIKMAEGHYHFVWTFHHVLSDGWCNPIIFRELMTCYHALMQNKPSALAEPVSFKHYVAYLNKLDNQEAIDFWTEQLAGVDSIAMLGIAKHEASEQVEASIKTQRLVLPRQFSSKLAALAAHCHCTMNTVLQAAWVYLLHRYSGQNQLTFGMVTSGRPPELDQVDNIIGPFISAVPITIDLDTRDCVAELLEKLQQQSLACGAQGHLSLAQIQGLSQLPNGASLFESLLVFENYPMDELMAQVVDKAQGGSLQAFSISAVDLANKSHYPITLNSFYRDEELVVKISYQTHLYESEAIDNLQHHLEQVLTSMAHIEPSQSVDTLEILPPSEVDLLVNQLQGPVEGYAKDTDVATLFAEQAAKTPDAIALNEQGETLTFAELNAQANQMAYYLRQQEVGPDVCVALCIERGINMVVAVLAILKAGGAYVPIDMRYSAERIAHIVEDAECAIMLTSQELMMDFTEYLECPVFPMDASFRSQILASFSTENISAEELGLSADNLAYVIYTSGSTGTPKGVMVEHRALLMYCGFASNHYYQDLGGSLLMGSIGFDLTAPTLYLPLLHGDTVVLGEEGNEIEDICQQLTEASQNDNAKGYLLRLTPSHLSAMIELLGDTQLNGRHVFVIGGEEFSPSLLATVQALLPHSRWFNHYGPTEGVIGCTIYAIANGATIGDSVPIGTPHSNHLCYVLDNEQQLVPFGSVGELYISGGQEGEGLARGYLGMDELTEQKFIANPFVEGGRIYRTGDLVRWQNIDGTNQLIFVGRADSQVKVRGFRIELGDIETHLTKLEPIKQSVVVARDISQGDEQGVSSKQLVAYVLLHELMDFEDEAEFLQHKSRLIGEFKGALGQSLADHMIPEIYVFVESFPLTINAKVDVKSLPEPTESDLFKALYSAPRNEVESALCQIWQDLLKLEEVGIEDNFFSLGGDSIISIQVVTRARKLGLELTVVDIFDHPTIAELGPLCKTLGDSNIDQGAVTGQLPALLPAQARFFTLPVANHQHYNQAILLELNVKGLAEDILNQLVEGLYLRHDGLRLRFRPEDSNSQSPKWQAYYQPFDQQMITDTVEYFDLSHLDGASQSEQIRILGDKLQASFSFEQGSLFKLAFFDLGGGSDKCESASSAQLLAICHHLLVDGVSWRILLSDLETGYQQLANNDALQLGAKTTSLKSFSEQLVEYGKSLSQENESTKQFWYQLLSQNVPALPPALIDDKGSDVSAVNIAFDKSQTELLLGQCHQTYRTQINELLLAGLYLGYCDYSGFDAMRVEMEGHGRQWSEFDVDLTETFGWFTSVYPLVISNNNDEGNGIANTIINIKELNRRLPDGGASFGVLKYIAHDEALIAHEQAHSIPCIYFNYLGQVDNVAMQSELLNLLDESAGQTVSLEQQLIKPISIEGRVKQGQLSLDITTNVLSSNQAQMFADKIKRGVEQVISHCLEAKPTFTNADFPLLADKVADKTANQGLSQQQLVALTTAIDNANSNAQIQTILPLTSTQEELLFAIRLDASAYLSQIKLEFKGQLDTAVLRQTWQLMADKHEVLRTGFNWQDGVDPVQYIVQKITLNWRQVDLSDISEAEQQERIEQLMRNEHQAGITQSASSAMRFIEIKLAADCYQLVWVFSHLLLDGWSIPVLMADFTKIYTSLAADEPVNIGKASQFRHYVQWRNSQANQEVEQYWQRQLKGYRACKSLSAYRLACGADVLNQQNKQQYIRYESRLSVSDCEPLRQTLRDNQLTLNTLANAVLAMLLSDDGKRQDIIYGETLSGRPDKLEGVESIAGMFIHTVPNRVQLQPTLSILEWLELISQNALLRGSDCQIGMGRVRQLIDCGEHEPFDVLLNVQNYPKDNALKRQFEQRNQLEVEFIRASGDNNFPLTFTLVADDDVVLYVHFSQSLFDQSLMQSLGDDFISMMQYMLSDMSRPVAEVIDWQQHKFAKANEQRLAALVESKKSTLGKRRRRGVAPQ